MGLALIGLLGAAVFADHPVAAWIAHCRLPLLDLLIGVVNPIGSGVTLLIACAALALLGRWLGRSRLHDAASLAAVTFVSAGVVEFTLKYLIGRPRPVAAAALVGSFVPEVDSFPSGHATSVFAVAAIFAAYYPRFRWPFYGLATAIALGRVYLERHYVSDIVAGAVLGMAFAAYLYGQRQGFLRRIVLERCADRPD